MPVRRLIIDHVTVGVADIERSRAFYAAALKPLGFGELPGGDELPGIAFGPAGLEDFIISPAYRTGAPVHVAFAADSRAQVDAFHAAGLAAGGRDHGPPGIRPQYSDGYYGAFLLDPDGHNVEAVFHEPR
jgi:catechol 2,3-dioxygenase-like lactoylglutathione lyase family enzyme